MKTRKINIFAFPSQTTVLFWLISITLVGAVVFGTAGTAPFPTRWLSPVFIVLAIWGFVSRPDRDMRIGRLEPVGERFPLLREVVEKHSRQVGLKRTPLVLLSNEKRIYTMGSFRRWYIVLGLFNAQSLESSLGQVEKSESAEVIILHELFHFKNGDYWQLGLLTELFQMIFPLMLWFMMLFGGWMLLLGLASQSLITFSPTSFVEKMPPETRSLFDQIFTEIFPSDLELNAIREKVSEINFLDAASFVFNISLPLIIIAILLWMFYLPLIWQMREFYADAGMVQTLGSTSPFWMLATMISEKIDLPQQSRQNYWTRLQNWTLKTRSRIIEYFSNIRKFSPDGRIGALSNPENVFYTWKRIAVVLGGLALILEIFLATPLTLPVIGQNPMHFATLMIVVVVAYFLLPQLMIRQSGWFDALRIIIFVNVIRLAWLCLTLGVLWVIYFSAPDYLAEVLRSAIYSTARYAGNEPFEINLIEFLTKATVVNLLQVPIIFIVQTLSVLGLIFLFNRMLCWYSLFSRNEIFRRTVFVVTTGLVLVLLFTVLPLTTTLLTGNLDALTQPFTVLRFLLGVGILVVGGWWFLIQDRQHYGKCPNCKADVPHPDQLIENCQSCGTGLLPWIWTEYHDE